MSNAEVIEKTLKREKEIFEEYIKHNGHLTELTFLSTKYEQEDNTPGSFSLNKISRYLSRYCESDLITEEEKEKKEAETISNKTMFDRGKKICKLLTSGNCVWSEVDYLCEEYAKCDGRLAKYKRADLQVYLNFYLKHTTNDTMRQTYKIVEEFRKRGYKGDYSVDIVDKILSFDSEAEAIEFIKNIGISKSSLGTIRNVYSVVYPTKGTSVNILDHIILECFKKNPEHAKSVTAQKNKERAERNYQKRMDDLKRLLQDYVTGDYEELASPLLKKYDYTLYKFRETLKDAADTQDLILQELLNQYRMKIAYLEARRSEEVEMLYKAINNGVITKTGVRSANSYDFYCLTNLPPIEFCAYANSKFPGSTAEKISDFMEKHVLNHRVYKTVEELINTNNYGKGSLATIEERRRIASFMQANNWPLSSVLFIDTAREYFVGNLEISYESELKHTLK